MRTRRAVVHGGESEIDLNDEVCKAVQCLADAEAARAEDVQAQLVRAIGAGDNYVHRNCQRRYHKFGWDAEKVRAVEAAVVEWRWSAKSTKKLATI